MAVLFFDGAETGDLGPWSGSSGSVAASTANPRSGAYSLAFTAIGAYVFPSTFAAQTTIYFRTYVYLHNLSASIALQQMEILQAVAGASTPYFTVCVVTDASKNPSFQLYNSNTSLGSPSTYATTADVWHLLEYKVVISATVGILELKVDGVVAISWTGLNTGTTSIDSCYFDMYNHAGTGTPSGTVYHDDMLVTTTGYPGPGSCRKVQATATTPNYDTWTKSNSSTINTVWDDTPYNATTNATQATSGNKQTGVMDVTGFLNAQDIVNAVKIGWVGKTSSVTTDGADSAIFRTPAGGGGADTTTAGIVYTVSDAYQEVLFTGITTAQIRSCEAGMSKGTGTNTHTVEDLWLMVDFTSVNALPLTVRTRWIHKQIPRVRAKRSVRNRWMDEHMVPAPHPDFPQNIRRRSQARRVPAIKAKPRVRNRWIDERQVTAPHADLPLSARHDLQKKRIAQIRPKRKVASSIELRIPQAPHADLPLAMRHPRGQTKRTPQIKAKRKVRSSAELRIPPAPHADFPQSIRRAAQKKRGAQVKAKRIVRNNIELRIPQAPHADLPLSARHDLQKKRIPQIKAKRKVLSNVELRIPQAPNLYFPLSIRRREQARRIPLVKRKRQIFGNLELHTLQVKTTLPLLVRRGQKKRFIRISRKSIISSRVAEIQAKITYPDPIWSGGPPPSASTLAAILAAQRSTPPQATALGAPGGIQVVQPQTIPGSPIRFSEPRNFAELTDRLNRAMTLLQDQLKALQTQINTQGAAVSPSALAALVAAAIGGGQAGSQAIAQGPVPGGPSPIPPYIKPHSLIVGEGSTPVHLYTLNDGQILIGCTGDDPRPAVIQGEGPSGPVVPIGNLVGIQVNVGCNQIQISLNTSVWNFLLLVASILGIGPPG